MRASHASVSLILGFLLESRRRRRFHRARPSRAPFCRRRVRKLESTRRFSRSSSLGAPFVRSHVVTYRVVAREVTSGACDRRWGGRSGRHEAALELVSAGLKRVRERNLQKCGALILFRLNVFYVSKNSTARLARLPVDEPVDERARGVSRGGSHGGDGLRRLGTARG